MASGTSAARKSRIESRERHTKWPNPPMYIDMSECINCDACLRACPPNFGAIFNHGIDVIILPELCSGCDKCLDPCPVDCIYPLPVDEWQPSPEDWWQEPLSANDPYV
ncbi:MAG: 4Fe-4S ferredoxin [Acidimicrobiaceae bacterium]|nr:4Fe-4S ferredoxin [Acidimicrobiaceae bacterium]